MDTKSKKFKLWERTAFRITIFFLCGICAAVAVCLALLGEQRLSAFQDKHAFYFSMSDAFSSPGFSESETFSNSVIRDASTLVNLYYRFADEGGAGITGGAAFEREVDETIRNLYGQIWGSIEEQIGYRTEISYEQYEEYDGIYESPDGNYVYDGYRIFQWWDPWYGEVIDFDTTIILESPVLMQNGRMKSYGEEGVRDAFIALYPEEIAFIRNAVAATRQAHFDLETGELSGVIYFAGDGYKTFSNVELGADGYPKEIKDITGHRAWVKIATADTASSLDSLNSRYDMWPELSRGTIYIAWPDESIAAKENLYYEARGIVQGYFFTAMALGALAIAFLVMSIVYTGRKRPAYDDTRKMWACDKIFVEFQIIIFFVLLATGGVLTASFLGSSYRYYMAANYAPYVLLGCAIGLVFVLTTLWFFLSLVRIGKAGLFAERSLFARLVKGPGKALAGTIKSGYDGRNPLAKTLIVVILFWFLTALFSGICGISLMRWNSGTVIFFGLLLLLTLAGAIHFTRKWAERYGQLRKGVEEIGSGNLGYQIEIESDGKNEFDRLSAMVNLLGSAQNTAIQNELKNQRLKTDLISNVSHDLKTPLTSIITYTDLLKNEGLKSKNAEEYLKVIDEKGRRLQKLTEDLFDAAKASSGAIPVRKEKVDMLALIRQEIAEMNGSFDEAGLELIIEAESEHYFVEADSQLLWRVADNLLRNARKYAQAGTRVYIELKEHASVYQGDVTFDRAITTAPIMTTLEIKNTSAVKLNIPPEELMERFKRGDESRASEGSGLGLAIAKDLVRLQDGWFELAIDGDLFKAIVMLPPWNGNE